MAQARSMQQVVDEAKLDWLETPDQAVVWGVALGLQGEVEGVLERTARDVKDGAATRGLPAGVVPRRRRRAAAAWPAGGGGLLFSSAHCRTSAA